MSLKYIQKNTANHWTIKKYLDKKWVTFGTFHSLREAMDYRDYLQEHNWDTSLIYKNPMRFIYLRRGKYEVQVNASGKRIYVGRFNTLEDAQYERDAFLKAGGDFDVYFECTDDTIDGKIPPMKICTRNLWETHPRNDAYMFNKCIKERY